MKRATLLKFATIPAALIGTYYFGVLGGLLFAGVAFLIATTPFTGKSPDHHHPSNAMDGFVRSAYGDKLPDKLPDLERAATLAHEDLLQEQISLADVQEHAAALLKGPTPYSTHDLAVSTALYFFRNLDYTSSLSEHRTKARTRVANWATAGKVNALLADAFEETVCKRYEDVETLDAPQKRFAGAERTDTYDGEIAARLSREFGVEEGNRISSDQQVKQVIQTYKKDGVPESKTAAYIIAKLKWGPRNAAETEVQRQLAEEFAKLGVDFMSMDPEVHFSLLREAILFGRVSRTVEMFFDVVDKIGRSGGGGDEYKAAMLAATYRERMKFLLPQQ
jgi:hypothetical protein